MDGASRFMPWNGTIRLEIIDDGKGFEPFGAGQGRLGLEAMRERAAGIGASLDIISKPGEGTRVVVIWTGHNVPIEVEACRIRKYRQQSAPRPMLRSRQHKLVQEKVNR